MKATAAQVAWAMYVDAQKETLEKKEAGIWSGDRLRERDAYEQGIWDVVERLNKEGL